MKAYVSEKLTNHDACRWDILLEASVCEASRILADAEPAQNHPMLGPGYWTVYEISEFYPNTSPMSDAGADLAADIKGMLSELDSLAHDCAPEVYGGNMSMLDMMIRNERVQA